MGREGIGVESLAFASLDFFSVSAKPRFTARHGKRSKWRIRDFRYEVL